MVVSVCWCEGEGGRVMCPPALKRDGADDAFSAFDLTRMSDIKSIRKWIGRIEISILIFFIFTFKLVELKFQYLSFLFLHLKTTFLLIYDNRIPEI